MASKKPIAKPASKKAAPKTAKAAPVKKATAPKKVVAKAPAKKVAPVAKKAVTPAAKKVAAKPVAKKAATKPAAKKVAPVVKPKASSAKVASTTKPNQKPAPAKKAVPAKAPQTMPKKVENKKEETKKVVKAEAKPAAKATKAAPPAKPAAKAKAAPAKPVVIPKTTTKTVRKYQPEFVKSILDEVEYTPGAPLIRYNDGELKEFRELIQRKLDSAKKELNYLQGLITRKDDMGGDESDNRYMTMEDGSLSMEREQLSQMASRQITFIDHLEKALMRIENKTYGICRVTGKLIDKARLRAVPHATLSIEAKMGISKG